MDKEQNHGLQIEKPRPDHYMLGGLGAVPQDILQADRNWTPFLPVSEVQSHDNLETYNCTRYGTYHAVAILMKRLFGPNQDADTNGDYNYSERFGGIVGNTTPNGNSPHTAGEDIRLIGLLDEMYLPFSADITDWDEYYNPKPMTKKYLSIAAKWPKKIFFKHDWVINGEESPDECAKKIYDALQYSPIGVAVYAWRQGNDGLYIRPDGASSSHWCVIINAKYGEYWEVFDTYAPFIKRLAWNHIATTEMAKRYYIKKNDQPVVAGFWEWIKKLLNFFIK